MSDQHESGPLPELTPEQEATVRRLLAEARHEEPLPVDVGDRLDRVLADLSIDSPDRSTHVVDLAARRRRRNAAGLLVAAAAVIVGGFAVGQVIDVGGSADDSGDSAGSTVERDQSANDQAAEAAPSTEVSADGDSVAPDSAAKGEPLRLTSQNLVRDVQRQLKRSSATAANLATDPQALQGYDAGFSCATAEPSAYGIGRLYPAYYDGIPTVLALRPATGGSQEAQVLECGTGTPLRSVTVPAP